MTLKASLYDQLTREELIRLLEARDNEPDNAEIYISSETPTIKRIISEVLAILFNEENKPIEKAMNFYWTISMLIGAMLPSLKKTVFRPISHVK